MLLAGVGCFLRGNVVVALQVVVAVHAQLGVAPSAAVALGALAGSVTVFGGRVFGGVDIEGLVAEIDVASVAFDFDGELMIFSILGEVLYFL